MFTEPVDLVLGEPVAVAPCLAVVHLWSAALSKAACAVDLERVRPHALRVPGTSSSCRPCRPGRGSRRVRWQRNRGPARRPQATAGAAGAAAAGQTAAAVGAAPALAASPPGANAATCRNAPGPGSQTRQRQYGATGSRTCFQVDLIQSGRAFGTRSVESRSDPERADTRKN